ncbi:MAG: hypothetical protein QNK04_08320 [Myxococcota bacterium]|nr:hypothetical protein [Myxococcota bacterium]
MRKLSIAVAMSFLVGSAGVAGAAPLNWSGTSKGYLAEFPPIVTTGGGVATINGSAGLGHIDSLRLAGSRGGVSADVATLLVTDPDTLGNSIAAILYIGVGGGTGTFAPVSGAVQSTTALTQNVLPVPGVSRICLVSTICNDFLDLIFTEQTVNGDTIGIGVGGLLTVGGDSPIKISLQAAPWTLKTVSVLDQILTTGKVNTETIARTYAGFVHDPASGTTSTAQPSGVVQLVTPSQIKTNLPFGTAEVQSSAITLRIHFIPEPGLILLLGSGVVGLVLLGRSRSRRP